jgi:drug/metabolite transporter (DMT)-like permease
VCILIGAYLASKKTFSLGVVKNPGNRLAIMCILVVVALRGVYSPLEVLALRETNPFYFNFWSSLLIVPVIMLVMYLRGQRLHTPAFSKDLMRIAISHRLGLLLIGITFTINLTCTYAAKLVADNAAYVTTLKGAQVLPMMVLGVLLFKEKIQARQWVGLGVILLGLVLFSQT